VLILLHFADPAVHSKEGLPPLSIPLLPVDGLIDAIAGFPASIEIPLK
jgi:hypothetical protein